jgi:hypothetical protein
MSTQIQFRGGSESEHQTFAGAQREITVDTTNNTIRVHDGVTQGGTRLARFDEIVPPGFTGGGTDQVFLLYKRVATTAYSIPAGYDADSIGPFVINEGVVITIPANSLWRII